MDPAGYDALIRDLSASMGKEESAELEKVRKIYDGTSADAEEEYWCNRFGELLQDPEKLRRFSLEMEMKNAGMARRILIRIREYIRSILDAMGGKDTLQERRLKRADEMVGKILDNLERKIGAETTAGDGIAKYSISGLYTGSSADYDRPSLHYVGTGEGSQVYGWGLYASSERGVAESYLPPKDKIERANQYREYLKRRIAEETDPHEKGFLEFNLREAEKARTTQSVYEQTFFTDRPDGDESHLIEWYSSKGIGGKNGLAKRVEQALPPDKAVAFRNGVRRHKYNYGMGTVALFGGDLYRITADVLGGYKEATDFLRDKLGIDGVKYPVGSFNGPVRDGDEVGWNYVSFRDDNIRVDHKWVDGEQKFSVSKVTPEQDAEYMEAVKNGDMEKARKMLIDAASEKGIVLDDGRMMYYRSGKLMYDDSGEVEDSFVIELVETPPEDRGQGIARKLLAAAFQKAGDEGLSATGYAYAQDDDTDQERLVDFYERIGFSVDEYDMVEASGDTLETGEHPEPLEVGKKDDAGNVIPLSQRFNARIRYSLSDNAEVVPVVMPEGIDLKDTNALGAYLKGKYLGQKVRIIEDGRWSRFTSRGLRDSLKRRGEHRTALGSLEELISRSYPVGYETVDKRHMAKRNDLRGQFIYAALLNVPGDSDSAYVATIKLDDSILDKYARFKDISIEKMPPLYAGLPPEKTDTLLPADGSAITVKQVVDFARKDFAGLENFSEKMPPVKEISSSDDMETRHSVTEDSPVRRKDLLAAHNLSESALRKAIQLGGFPMPSIAVFKDTMGHSHYGGISLLFAPSTIDPKAGRNNIYSGDAWTPTFPEIRFEASGEAESRIYGRYEELRKKAGNDLARPLMKYGTDLQDELNRHEGSAGIIDREMNDADMAKAFLADNGRAIPDPVFDERTESLPEGMSDIYERVVSRMGRDVFKEVPENIMAPLMQKWLAAHAAELEKAYQEATDEHFGSHMSAKSGIDARKVAARIRRYVVNGPTHTVRTENYAATRERILEAVDKAEYRKWLSDLFAGVEKSRGIYNGKDRFARSGNRRTFSATHDPVTIANVVRAMLKTQPEKGGLFGKNPFAAATEQYKSLNDVVGDEGRLRWLDEEVLKELKGKASEKLKDIAFRIASRRNRNGYESEISTYMDVVDALLDA